MLLIVMVAIVGFGLGVWVAQWYDNTHWHRHVHKGKIVKHTPWASGSCDELVDTAPGSYNPNLRLHPDNYGQYVGVRPEPDTEPPTEREMSNE